MDDFQCDMLEMLFHFPLEEMDRDAFLATISELGVDINTDDAGNVRAAIFLGSREQPPKQHAHLRVRLGKKKGTLELIYFGIPIKVKNEKLPYVEDCAQWLGQFFKSDTMKAHTHVTYTFDKSFSPVIVLPFPLFTSEKTLAGSLVSGLSILLPKEDPPETAIIQTSGDETHVSLGTTLEVNLKDFDLFAELKRLSVSLIHSLVKKQETDGEQGGADEHGE